jgi:hypothetical protein
MLEVISMKNIINTLWSIILCIAGKIKAIIYPDYVLKNNDDTELGIVTPIYNRKDRTIIGYDVKYNDIDSVIEWIRLLENPNSKILYNASFKLSNGIVFSGFKVRINSLGQLSLIPPSVSYTHHGEQRYQKLVEFPWVNGSRHPIEKLILITAFALNNEIGSEAVAHLLAE